MKYALLLLGLVVLSTAQFRFRPRQRPQQFFSPQQFFRGPPNPFRSPTRTVSSGIPSQGSSGGRGGGADDTNGGSEYHFSWRHDNHRKYTGGGARAYCNGLGGGWQAVSIETGGESSYINGIITSNRLDYIWTGGEKRGSGWSWPSKRQFSGLNWSHKGGARRPQPDNREGNENCLAILNDFYGDGVKWHDVACHHTKPVICERSA